MRALRRTLAAAWIAGLAPAAAMGFDITTDQLLKFRPTQKGVDYDVPTDPAYIAACKVETIPNGKGGTLGWALRDGQGKMVCKFVDLNGNGKLDQWSYFQDGFEIYREVDQNDDKQVDEARWMNAAGTRVARVSQGKVVGWSRLSPEEASKVFVQGLVAGDADLIESVMATPTDLEALGVPASAVEQASVAAKNRAASVKTLRGGLAGWDANTVWLRLDAALPHLIPADAGLKDDLLLYENAVIFAGAPNGGGNAGKVAFLQAGEVVKVGDTWKFVDLPRAIDPAKNAVIAALDGGIRSAVFRASNGPAAGSENPALVEPLNALAAYDKANEALLGAGDARSLAKFHYGRLAPLGKVAKAAEAAGDARAMLDHQKMIVDSLAAAYTTGAYPAGAKQLDELTAQGGKIGSYAAFKQIEAEFAIQNNADQGNTLAVQENWLGKLKGFVEKYPQSDEAPQALLFLASTNEMNGRETEARKYYAQLAEQSPSTEWGKKATGAINRLDLVGKPLGLKGQDLKGQSVDSSSPQYRGKTLLVTFWATWAKPAKQDLPELAKLYAKYKAKGFEVIAVNLDNDRADLDAFLKESPMPWHELFEPGGMESRLATEYGIILLPTMFLVDPDGKVSHRGLRSAAEVEAILEKGPAGKTPGVALGN